jgi:hypothetical protein
MSVRFRFAAIVFAAMQLGLAACGSTYYLVKDAESGREYCVLPARLLDVKMLML